MSKTLESYARELSNRETPKREVYGGLAPWWSLALGRCVGILRWPRGGQPQEGGGRGEGKGDGGGGGGDGVDGGVIWRWRWILMEKEKKSEGDDDEGDVEG